MILSMLYICFTWQEVIRREAAEQHLNAGLLDTAIAQTNLSKAALLSRLRELLPCTATAHSEVTVVGNMAIILATKDRIKTLFTEGTIDVGGRVVELHSTSDPLHIFLVVSGTCSSRPAS